jgi:ATP-dependent RNA helicase DeaD
MTSFSQYPLDPKILTALNDLGYDQPTPIQEKTLPLVLNGDDVIALAETGSGKTAACAIPVCSRINQSEPYLQALVMVPTRELALQYATAVQKVGRVKEVKAFALYGGEDMELQKAKLRSGVHVLVATPGRLIDFIYQHAIDLSHVNTLILDEADQMLSLGFYEDLNFIMDCLVQSHQTLLFSATMPDSILKLSQKHMRQPKEIRLIEGKPTPKNLAHYFLFCPDPKKKQECLLSLLPSLQMEQSIIFANARHEVEKLFYALKPRFHPIDFLHGGLAQSIRSTIIQKFSKGKIKYLVASDVASRGLDFTMVSHVVNLHVPLDLETYLHRAGRTGRIGNKGACITVVTKRDLKFVTALIEHIQSDVHWIGKPPGGFQQKQEPQEVS